MFQWFKVQVRHCSSSLELMLTSWFIGCFFFLLSVNNNIVGYLRLQKCGSATKLLDTDVLRDCRATENEDGIHSQVSQCLCSECELLPSGHRWFLFFPKLTKPLCISLQPESLVQIWNIMFLSLCMWQSTVGTVKEQFLLCFHFLSVTCTGTYLK